MDAIQSLVKSGGFWFPEAISNLAKDVDILFYVILLLLSIAI